LNYAVSILSILLIIFHPSAGQKHKTSPIPQTVKRILFIGNSITYSGEYITNVETYLVTHYPGLKAEFINVGLPSETVSGLSEPGHADGKFPRPDLHERLARVLKQTKPDWVFACYGMNDGIYLPLDEERFTKYRDGITWLHNELEKAGVKKIIHLTPPVFDERKSNHPGYDQVLEVYSNWLLAQREKSAWNVIDIHGPMKSYLESRLLNDPSFALANDGVHPGATGHWIMSKEILMYLGELDIGKVESINDVLNTIPSGEQILGYVSDRQMMMKDAWLTRIGHQRPGMKVGLPLGKAKKKAKKIQKEIETLQLKGTIKQESLETQN
jgi:lysophospholipase L1-like esterase